MRLDVRLIARLLSLLEDLERDQSGSKEFSFLSFSLFERSPLRGISFERFGDASRVYTRNYMPAPLEETRENGFFQGYFLPALKTTPAQLLTRQKAILQMEAQQAERGCDLLLRTVPFDLSDVFPIR